MIVALIIVLLCIIFSLLPSVLADRATKKQLNANTKKFRKQDPDYPVF
jgi:hypothetical protein